MADQPIGGVSRNLADIGNSGAAVWANKFMVVAGPVVKIIFMEQGGPEEPVFFRTAAVMSHQDAIALKNLLGGILAETEKRIQEAMTKAGAAPNA